MAKRKLERFNEMKGMDRVIQPSMEDIKNDDFHLKGKWCLEFFGKEGPLIIELGCGKGEYSVGLGKKYPDKNFIGVDIKGARIWRGAKDVEEHNLENVGFIRSKIDFIDRFFGEGEVDEIWLTFSDPQKEKPRKRLTGPLFINRYRKFLKPGGVIHLKTDSDLLYEFTLEEIKENGYKMIESTGDVYGDYFDNLSEDEKEVLNIRTHYEKLFASKGHIIKYCRFQVD
ncbi:MAG: tRNA (guanosine(46)-N7)-methyltransferase TrmB [Crocinitomicaceae bacterium]|nr:tRNA (guanosine(46)-N7)-methyltransferase TrmB [Crocinitomicaceae bacterium]